VAVGSEDSEVLIIGGGSAGLTVAARLRRIAPDLAVTVLEPSDHHFYQPLWTLVGAGVLPKEKTGRPEASVLPRGVRWVQEAAAELDPKNDQVVTARGRRLRYRFLVMAPGIQIDWDAIPGLREGLASGPVTSNWSYDTVDKTWELIRGFKGGTALFTLPATPVKCPGAAQKIMYLADDHFRRAGVRDGSRIVFVSRSSPARASRPSSATTWSRSGLRSAKRWSRTWIAGPEGRSPSICSTWRRPRARPTSSS
jgi:sulfide:quinone oxidoreductase